MVDKRKLALALRNGINKLSGKQTLIDEYEDATHIIAEYLDKMKSGKEKENLTKAFEKLDETKLKSDGKGGVSVGGFNQYESSKKTLKQKVAQAQQIMKQFGIER